MSIKFELDSPFLRNEGIPLSPDELRFGFENGWLRTQALVEEASRYASHGCSVPWVIALARLSPAELARAREIAAAPDVISPDAKAAAERKWLYLELRAAYDSRTRLDDPLSVVEAIYADFDYPTQIEGFVRYMPIRTGEASGAEALVTRWKEFLDAEREALRRSSKPGFSV